MKNKGITLVALIITIIILLILSGITIATLGGENGLFKKVKLGKERYAISEAKEKLELEITNLQIEQNGKGEELTKEDLPKMNSDEIDVRDTTNFPVEVIYKNYKFEVDSNFQVTYVGEANETIITYTTEPDGYTNKNEVKVLVKITNPKGIKSILKPGETDKILPQDRTTAGIEFTVTKNGHYILKVEDVDGNEVSKDIYIDLIDTQAPKEFTISVQNTENSLKIIANTEDEEKEYSTLSGIDKYEYFIKASTEDKYIKYDTNEISELQLGKYSVYVIAYDKAGNSTKSEEITAIFYGEGSLWEKWNIEKEQIEYTGTTTMRCETKKNYTAYKSVTRDKDGNIILSDKIITNLTGLKDNFYDFGNGVFGKGVDISKANSTIQTNSTYYNVKFSTFTTILPSMKGNSFIDYIVNKNKDEYPDNGEKDGYWYVKIDKLQ